MLRFNKNGKTLMEMDDQGEVVVLDEQLKQDMANKKKGDQVDDKGEKHGNN